MRIAVVAAIHLSIMGLATAADVQGAMNKVHISIPAQDLGPALRSLAKERKFQIVFASRDVSALHTAGAMGEYTAAEALTQILSGTGLTFRYLDEKTVTIVPLAAAPVSWAPSAVTEERKGAGSPIFQVAAADSSSTDAATPGLKNKDNSTSTSKEGGEEKLEEIIVTAQKRSELLQDVPISMSVLSGNALDNSTYDGVTDALNTVPGIAAVAYQFLTAGTYLEIRGVSASGVQFSGASTVGYYVDSVPFGMIRSALVPNPNVYDLQRVEVLRGPQGTLYGANSLNGVVRVLTNDPDLNSFDFKARGTVSTTESGGVNSSGDMAVNIPIIEGKLAARAVVGDDHESGWIDGPLGKHLNSGELSNARLKISARPTDALSIDVSAWHSQATYAAPNLSDGNGQNFAVHPEANYTQFNAYGAKVNYELPVFSVSSMTSYVVYANPNSLDGGAIDYPATFNSTLTSRVFSEEMNLTSHLQGPWRWSAGAMYRDDKDVTYQTTVNYPEPTTTTLSDNFYDRSRSWAVYGEVGQRFFDGQLQWTLGARYFHDDEGTQAIGLLPGYNVPPNLISATSSATTPRAVLSWFPNKDLTAYVSYSQGFRSGIPQDELVGSVVGYFPALQPDKLTNYEVGVKGNLWDQQVSYDAAVYYLTWHDIQQSLYVIIPNTNGESVQVLVNGGSASGEGAEFSLKTRPFSGLTLGTNFSWNNVHFNSTIISGRTVLFYEGARANGSPEYTAGMSAQYGFPLGGTGLTGAFSASGNYIAALNTTTLGLGANPGNSLVLTQGNFSIQFPTHWTVTLFVDNANNYHGTQAPVGPPHGGWDARLRPRTYGVRFDYHLR